LVSRVQTNKPTDLQTTDLEIYGFEKLSVGCCK